MSRYQRTGKLVKEFRIECRRGTTQDCGQIIPGRGVLHCIGQEAEPGQRLRDRRLHRITDAGHDRASRRFFRQQFLYRRGEVLYGRRHVVDDDPIVLAQPDEESLDGVESIQSPAYQPGARALHRPYHGLVCQDPGNQRLE